MPFFYATGDKDRATTTTEGVIGRFLTVSNQSACLIYGIYASYLSATAGGFKVRLVNWGTAGTAGTGQTPVPRDTGAPASSTTFLTGSTIGSGTRKQHMSIGGSQVGGQGAWVAFSPDHAITLEPNGGANGNLDILQLATTAASNLDYTIEFLE